ncbi:MAG: tetratricopeptide repeat protein [Candidatus Tectomicrobia bacterium]|nr:tetratricopeptide repeat protein [Candidatus Tectomicrobia bacterium]
MRRTFYLLATMLVFAGLCRPLVTSAGAELKAAPEAPAAPEIPASYRGGVEHFANHRFFEASAALREFLQKYPENPYRSRALYLLAESEDVLNAGDTKVDLPQLISQYRDALLADSTSPRAPAAMLRVARLYSEENFIIEARDTLTDLIERFPRHPNAATALFDLGKLALREERYDEAMRLFERLLREHKGSQPARLGYYYLGMASFKKERYGEALEFFQKGIQTAPEELRRSSELLRQFGETHYALRRYQEAREAFLQHTKLFPESQETPHLLVRTADTFMQEKRFDMALPLYAHTLELYPGNDAAIVARLRLADLGVQNPKLTQRSDGPYTNFREPIATYQEVARANRGHPLAELALLKAAHALRLLGRRGEALDPLRRLLAEYPNSQLLVNAHDAMKIINEEEIEEKFSQQQYLSVVETYYANFAYLPRDQLSYAAQFKIARSLQELGFLDLALDTYQALYLELDHAGMPEQLLWHIYEVFQAQGDVARATALMERFQARFPASSYLVLLPHLRADISYGRAAWQEAITWYLRALGQTVPPWRRSLSLYRLGKAYAAAGRQRETSAALVRLLKLNEAAPALRQLQPLLDDAAFTLANAWFLQRWYDKALAAYYGFIARRGEETAASFGMYHVAGILEEVRRLRRSPGEGVRLERAWKSLAQRSEGLWPLVAEQAQSSRQWQTRVSRLLQELRRHSSDRDG